MIKKLFLICCALAVAALTFSGCSPTKANNPPTNLSLSKATIIEDAAANTVVGMFATQDADAGNVFTYSLVAGSGAADNASFIIRTDTLLTATSFDYNVNKTCSIRVQTKDQNQAAFDTTFTITVLHVNHAPTAVTLGTVVISDNATAGTMAGILAATDKDAADHHTFTLVAGAGSDDNASFTVRGDTLLSAAAFDASGAAVQQAFTVTVVHANHAPAAVALSNAAVVDTIAPGAFVGKLSATDRDAADKHTYTLAAGAGSSDNASFTVRNDSLLVNAALDANVKALDTIRIRAADDSGATADSAFIITLVHSPTNILLSNSVINESATIGTSVGILHAVDKDSATESYTFSLVGGDTGTFGIAWGAVNTKTLLNWGLDSSSSITVKASDGKGAVFQKLFTIRVSKTDTINGAVIFSERPSTDGVLGSSYSVWDQPDSAGNKTYFNWTPYDHFEGTKAYELTTNGAVYSEWGFQSYSTADLSLYTSGKMHVALMGGTPEIGIGMASAAGTDTLFVKATDFGYVADGKWHDVWIPLSTWASQVDFTAVTMLVGFKCPAVAGGTYVVGSKYTVDDIYITKK
jgi:hypothetical protein